MWAHVLNKLVPTFGCATPKGQERGSQDTTEGISDRKWRKPLPARNGRSWLNGSSHVCAPLARASAACRTSCPPNMESVYCGGAREATGDLRRGTSSSQGSPSREAQRVGIRGTARCCSHERLLKCESHRPSNGDARRVQRGRLPRSGCALITPPLFMVLPARTVAGPIEEFPLRMTVRDPPDESRQRIAGSVFDRRGR